MNQKTNFMIDLSVLYRNTQKYFDHVLAPFGIGWGQMIFLFFVYEQEGITMQEVTRISQVDKGTTTKAVQKLQESGYVTMKTDAKDKRVKRLYTTAKTTTLMNELYEFRNTYRSRVFEGLDADYFEDMIQQACQNSRESIQEDEEVEKLFVGDFAKVSLSDWKGKIASTISTAGCNFKCLNCPHKNLVFVPEDYSYISSDEIFTYLTKRIGSVQGVCIKGGEPLMHKELFSLLTRLKDMGYPVQLYTNGYYPDALQQVIDRELVDEVVMDIKSNVENYASTVGLQQEAFDIQPILQSIEILKKEQVPYRFTCRYTNQEVLQDILNMVQDAQFIWIYVSNEEERQEVMALCQNHEAIEVYVKETAYAGN